MGLHTVQHFTENDPFHVVQLARELQLHQHAIHLVGLGIHIFHKQDSAGSANVVWSTQRRDQQRQAAAIKNSFCSPIHESNDSRTIPSICSPSRKPGHRCFPRSEIDSVCQRKILGHHGAVKRHKSGRVGEARQQGCDVAVAHKNLRMRDDLTGVKFGQQVIRAVASTRTQDGPHILAHKHLFQFARAPIRRASEVQILFDDRLEVERLVSKLAQCFAAFFEQFALDVAGRSNNADRISKLESSWLDARSLRTRTVQDSILDEKLPLEDKLRWALQEHFFFEANHLSSSRGMHSQR